MDINIELPTCLICMMVCKDPKVDTCGHSYCSVCLTDWKKKRPYCPINPSASLSILTSNLALHRLLEGKTFSCKYKANGCSRMDSIKNMQKYHSSNCIWRNVNNLMINILNNPETANFIRTNKITLADGSIFEGLVTQENEPFFGKLKLANGEIYEGKFANCLLNGAGKHYFGNYLFEGEFKENSKNGYGVLYKKSTVLLEGIFANNLPQSCTIYNKHKRKLKGTFVRNDQGAIYKLILTSGDTFEGELKNFWPKKGVWTFTDGNKWTGLFEKKQIEGCGRLDYSNGDYYEGSFKQGKYNGAGKSYKRSSNILFEGTFEDGLKCGPGKILRSNNVIFEGIFLKDEINGQSTFYGPDDLKMQIEILNGMPKSKFNIHYSNGDSFNGLFVDEVRANFKAILSKINDEFQPFLFSMKGILKYKTGEEYHGCLKNGQREGEGKLVYTNGDTFTGKYVNNKANGEGTIQFIDKSILKGIWKNDKLEGSSNFIGAKGEKIKHVWKDGKLQESVSQKSSKNLNSGTSKRDIAK